MLLVYTIFRVKVNKKFYIRLNAVSIYIYAARVCGYILTIHLYVMYIVYFNLFQRERENYTLSLTLIGHHEDIKRT